MCCHNNYQHKFDENLKDRSVNRYKLSTHNKNKLFLLSHKAVDPYEYMDDWEKFNGRSLPEKKKDFYSHLNMEDITDVH